MNNNDHIRLSLEAFRKMWNRQAVYEAFNIRQDKMIPNDTGDANLYGFTLSMMTSRMAAGMDAEGWNAPTNNRDKNHRIHVHAPCGRNISAGRFVQHIRACKCCADWIF